MALSINYSGKYTSANHYAAQERGLKTAGEAAREISKATGKKILARDIRPWATEWHHSGFYGRNMGKTWFFDQDTIRNLISKFS